MQFLAPIREATRVPKNQEHVETRTTKQHILLFVVDCVILPIGIYLTYGQKEGLKWLTGTKMDSLPGIGESHSNGIVWPQV